MPKYEKSPLRTIASTARVAARLDALCRLEDAVHQRGESIR
jgi:hypothetical protein